MHELLEADILQLDQKAANYPPTCLWIQFNNSCNLTHLSVIKVNKLINIEDQSWTHFKKSTHTHTHTQIDADKQN